MGESGPEPIEIVGSMNVTDKKVNDPALVSAEKRTGAERRRGNFGIRGAVTGTNNADQVRVVFSTMCGTSVSPCVRAGRLNMRPTRVVAIRKPEPVAYPQTAIGERFPFGRSA